jgi:hypothetical protein
MGMDREAYNSAPAITGNKRVWFLNGDLVRIYHLNRAGGIVAVYNIVKDRIETCLLSDFKKNRERAYSVKETSILVNRHQKYLPTLMKKGIIPYPTGAQKDGVRAWQVRSYYSESQVKEIRDILASFTKGRPRKDGLINNNITPSAQELSRRMGDGMMLYTKTEDGRFVPVWQETV